MTKTTSTMRYLGKHVFRGTFLTSCKKKQVSKRKYKSKLSSKFTLSKSKLTRSTPRKKASNGKLKKLIRRKKSSLNKLKKFSMKSIRKKNPRTK